MAWRLIPLAPRLKLGARVRGVRRGSVRSCSRAPQQAACYPPFSLLLPLLLPLRLLWLIHLHAHLNFRLCFKVGAAELRVLLCLRVGGPLQVAQGPLLLRLLPLPHARCCCWRCCCCCCCC